MQGSCRFIEMETAFWRLERIPLISFEDRASADNMNTSVHDLRLATTALV